MFVAGFITIHDRGNMPVLSLVDFHNFGVLDDLGTELLILAGNGLPQLTGTILRIPELLDEGCFLRG